MRLEHLKFFLEVSKTGSLRTAANNLYITQPALGSAISSLEKELGYPLFIRTHTGMQLTPYAMDTIPIVQTILANVDACNEIKRNYLTSSKNTITEALNIVTIPSIGTGILPKLISTFAQNYPYIKLVILEMNSTFAMNQLILGQCDLAFIVVLDEGDFCSDYTAELLWQEPLYAFMRKDNDLAKKRSISLKSLIDYPLAIMSYEQNDLSVDDELFSQYGNANIAFRTNNYHLLNNYVLNTDCIGLIHFAHTIEDFSNKLFSPDVAYIPIKGCPISKFIALYQKDNPKIKTIQLFIDELRQIIK